MDITMVMAATPEGGIGTDTGLPWKCKPDMYNFKELTMGETVIVSLKTLLTIPNRLAGRRVFALTRSKTTEVLPNNVTICLCPITALLKARGYAMEHKCKEIFVIGGKQIYDLYTDQLTKANITMIGHGYITEEPTVFINIKDYVGSEKWQLKRTLRMIELNPKRSIWVSTYEKLKNDYSQVLNHKNATWRG